MCSEYILEQPAIQILHRMPITKYKSYLVGLAVSQHVALVLPIALA